MELRELRSFLVVAEEENMTRAAEKLHLTQPTLSKQIKALETELGQKLFVRQGFGIALTEEGRLLRERAEGLVAMADKVKEEFTELDNITGGVLHFGLAESFQIKYLAREIAALRKSCPHLTYHVDSGTTRQVLDKLDAGIMDFVVLAELPDRTRYEFVKFPDHEHWGVVMAKSAPLAKKKAIAPADLKGLQLFCSDQSWARDIPRWAGRAMGDLTREASFGLAYNGAIFAREKLGYLLAFDHIVDTGPGSGLVFRPLEPPLHTDLYFTWKRGRPLTPIAERFCRQVREAFGG